jgi:hypothetical protein
LGIVEARGCRLVSTEPFLIAEPFPATAAQWMLTVERELRPSTVVAPDISPFFQGGAIRLRSSRPPACRLACGCSCRADCSIGSPARLPIRTAAFFAATGVFFFRFLRLAAVVWLVSGAAAMAARVSGSLLVRSAVLIGVAALGLIADFAKVRAVVEDRRSMLAPSPARRFVRRRVWRVLGLALLNGLTMLAIVRILFQIDETPAPPWVSLLLSIGWILLGTAAGLAFLASEVVFFQGELAHAGYTAAPLPVWPDSPAVGRWRTWSETDLIRKGLGRPLTFGVFVPFVVRLRHLRPSRRRSQWPAPRCRNDDQLLRRSLLQSRARRGGGSGIPDPRVPR